MLGFGSSSSSSSSSSSNPPQEDIERPAPTREQRKACWDSRDLYFSCLGKNGVLQAGDEVKKDAKGNEIPGQTLCSVERKGYEVHCGKSWIDYFNKRRTLELRRIATIEAAEKSGNQQAAEAWRSVSGSRNSTSSNATSGR